ncbi:MAG: DPP IV N-terminal domain-containing protein, partial [Bacteroidetes bacterium]|nr:DPP IV N-terminal domain-containing protein [Bacteroidota bacterium]
MMQRILTAFLIIACLHTSAQQLGKLTVDKIMRDPKWIGTSPSNTFWSYDGSKLYFNWNPDQEPDDSLYYITLTNHTPVKATVAEKQSILSADDVKYNQAHTAFVYSLNGDIYYTLIKGNKTKRITQTAESESNPVFSFNDTKIVYSSEENLYAWDINTGEIQQLTNLKSGGETTPPTAMQGRRRNFNNEPVKKGDEQEEWLKKDQLQYFEVLRTRKEKREAAAEYFKNTRPKEMRTINIGDGSLSGLSISPDGRFISYRIFKRAANAKSTIVPNYITETGFTTEIPGRTKVGAPMNATEFFIYDREKDTVMSLPVDEIPGIKDLPDYVKDYPKELEERT